MNHVLRGQEQPVTHFTKTNNVTFLRGQRTRKRFPFITLFLNLCTARPIIAAIFHRPVYFAESCQLVSESAGGYDDSREYDDVITGRRRGRNEQNKNEKSISVRLH